MQKQPMDNKNKTLRIHIGFLYKRGQDLPKNPSKESKKEIPANALTYFLVNLLGRQECNYP